MKPVRFSKDTLAKFQTLVSEDSGIMTEIIERLDSMFLSWLQSDLHDNVRSDNSEISSTVYCFKKTKELLQELRKYEEPKNARQL